MAMMIMMMVMVMMTCIYHGVEVLKVHSTHRQIASNVTLKPSSNSNRSRLISLNGIELISLPTGLRASCPLEPLSVYNAAVQQR